MLTPRSRGGARSGFLPSLTVLHIDDDPNDTELLRAATRKADVPFLVHNVEDGEKAIAYLSGHGVYADRNRYELPSLILLDLKMPRATGFEILRWIRGHPELGNLPVIVLSGSELEEDMHRAYQIGANSYHVKPIGFEALVSFIKQINSDWIKPGHSAAV